MFSEEYLQKEMEKGLRAMKLDKDGKIPYVSRKNRDMGPTVMWALDESYGPIPEEKPAKASS
jgi:hypothetical protein